MDKLQTQITEYIKDYMDKTLSEGCLFGDWTVLDKKHFFKISENKTAVEFKWFNYYTEILGHYDITAVETFILKIQWKSWTSINLIKEWKYKEIGCKWWINIVYPNKPLHLYSEQEKKDLLELLKKLWQ